MPAQMCFHISFVFRMVTHGLTNSVSPDGPRSIVRWPVSSYLYSVTCGPSVTVRIRSVASQVSCRIHFPRTSLTPRRLPFAS